MKNLGEQRKAAELIKIYLARPGWTRETNGDKIAKVVGDVTRGGNPDMQIAINRVVFGPGAA